MVHLFSGARQQVPTSSVFVTKFLRLSLSDVGFTWGVPRAKGGSGLIEALCLAPIRLCGRTGRLLLVFPHSSPNAYNISPHCGLAGARDGVVRPGIRIPQELVEFEQLTLE